MNTKDTLNKNNDLQQSNTDTSFYEDQYLQHNSTNDTLSPPVQEDTRDIEDINNSRIAVFLLFVGIICAILIIVLSANAIWKYWEAMHKEIDNDYMEFEDIFSDLDIEDISDFSDIDSLFSEEEPSSEIPNTSDDVIASEKSNKSNPESGTAILDFCENDALDEFAEDIANQKVRLFVYKDDKRYDTDDENDILKVFDAVKTVRIGDIATTYGDGEWLEIDFFDSKTQTSWSFSFWGNCFQWKQGEHYEMYQVLDWGELDGLSIDSLHIVS